MKRILIFIVLIGMYAQVSFSQTGIPRAQAMFIYNFSRLIDWPANYKTGPFIIGVFGASGILNELQNYTNGKSVGQQSIEVKRYDEAGGIEKCHILFIPFSKTKNMGEILGSIGNNSTLIVTEKNGALDAGSAINFQIIGDKLKFEVKEGNASKYGIKLSAKLQEMAVN
jgi:hypothetical protein